MTHSPSNLVAGNWTAEGGDGFDEDLNPSDIRDVLGRVPRMDREQAEAAVDAAALAAPGWAATSPVERGEILRRAGEVLRDRAAEIAALLGREAGKPGGDALGEILKSAEFLEYYGSLGRAPIGDVLPDARRGVVTHTRVEPVGVVVAITPWNDPFLTPARKLGPALISGNAVVLKPASNTPLVGHELARALADAGLPPGVLNTVTGGAGVVGPALTTHPGVAAVTFTGSTSVGKGLQHQLAGSGTRLQTEMGGKNAIVVMPDADIELAAATIAGAAFGQAGQRCTATSRLIVHADVRDALVSALCDAMSRITVGPAASETTTYGPVISQAQLDTVLTAIGRGTDEGGRVVHGGSRLTGDPLDHGFFVEPTLIEVQPVSTLWREEVFGPVLALTTVDDLDSAIDLVNDSTYGLSAGIFTRSLEHSHAFAARVVTGQVSVNLPTSGWDVHLPFGGFKDSGSPFKEQGTGALGFYTRVKTVAMRVG